tara:strand:- start:139 stop:870 length:732 start_codon:yes stop_codon:yes gene_type:complete
MDQIVFFWVGNNNEIPSLFVNSIRLVDKNNIKIIQITDYKTETVKKIDEVIRCQLPKDIMLARLKGFSLINTTNDNTFFCDADSLLLNKLRLDSFEKGIYLAKRNKNFYLNSSYPEQYPEFVNKTIFEIMPFLFGGIIVIKRKNFFSELFKFCTKLPERFHRWYGDQVSLYMYYLQHKNKISFFDQEEFLHLIGSKKKYPIINVEQLKMQNIKFITFKGPQSIDRIKESFNDLSKILKKNHLS